MLEKLTDDNEAIRVSAARSIGYLAGDPAQAIPALTAALKDPSAMVRINAATSLAQFGAGAREAVPVLLGLLRSSDEELKFTLPAGESQPPGWNERLQPRSYAVRALGRFAPEAKEVLPILIETLRDPEQTVRQAALDSLAQIGPEAKLAVPALIEMLKSPSVEDQIDLSGHRQDRPPAREQCPR
jgi:HEAT repeat protein